MLVGDLLRRLEGLDPKTPIVFSDEEGGWSNFDIFMVDGFLHIRLDFALPFSDE